MTEKEIIELLTMPWPEFEQGPMKQARELWRQQGNELDGVAMVGYDNHCRNKCQYCGMSALCPVERFRLEPEEVLRLGRQARESGFSRIFLVSGENRSYGFGRILDLVSGLSELGLEVRLGMGELEREEYRELARAGCSQYVLKFECSDPQVFARIKPTSDYTMRMRRMEWVKESGMGLASGNIVDFPGHTLETMAEDILLMERLEISWAPVIPYMPAPNTPMAASGKRGDIRLNLREISILRLLMPQIDITAQQPGEDLKKGLADREGNQLALAAGANMLFADLLSPEHSTAFRVVDNRITLGLEHMEEMAALAGMGLRR